MMSFTTVLSYPDRGQGGNAKWRGNHSPRLSEDLFLWLKPKQVVDPMCGSGTTGDVASRMGISCWQNDLHSGFNILRDELPVMGDVVFFHDPYHDIIQYSGSVWGDKPPIPMISAGVPITKPLSSAWTSPTTTATKQSAPADTW